MFKELKQYQGNKWPNYILWADTYTDMQVYEKCSAYKWMGKCKSKAEDDGVHECDWLIGSRREQQEGRLMCRKESPDTQWGERKLVDSLWETELS